MAAEVSSLVRIINGYRDEPKVGHDHHRTPAGNSTSLITRDLLGGGVGFGSSSIKNESQELDLDMEVPSGWEKRLDLKSGKVYLQRCNCTTSSISPSSSDQMANRTVAKLQDLNIPHSPSSKVTLNLFDEGNLDLKVVSTSSTTSSGNYQSVCTLDKVKSALERAEKEPLKRRSTTTQWNSPTLSSSPSSSSSSSFSLKEVRRQEEEDHHQARFPSSPVAAGCPGCLSYVLITKSNPKCPRCNTLVPLLPVSKKPRIDLNMSI